ncbi:caudovirus prohead protease family protein [Sphingobium sp. RAC03]|nr:caudovirus prohead protease family protein [Sphingobium sp. RAC03]
MSAYGRKRVIYRSPRRPENQGMNSATPATSERRIMAASQVRSANIAPTSWNPETRTIDVVWTTGARGVKFDWNAGETVDEELETGPIHVRLDRLNAGAPVLDTHQRGGLANQIGTVVPGSARMQGGQGIATLKLSERPEIASLVDDIANGIIRNLSVGYTVHSYEIERNAGGRPLYRAIDWEPFEISFVPVPFDALAQVRNRSGSAGLFPCTLRSHSSLEIFPMTTRTNGAPVAPSTDTPEPPNGPAATIAQLRTIGDMAASQYNISRDAVSSVVLEMAERGLSAGDARSEMLRILGEVQNEATAVRSGGSRGGASDFIARSAQSFSNAQSTFENPAFHGNAIEDALYARMSGRAPTDQARQFMHMSLVQIAGEVAQRAGVSGVQHMAPGDVLNAAALGNSRMGGGPSGYLHSTRSYDGSYHTTSSFPDLLTGAGQRFLMDMFAAAESPLKKLGRRRGARDFRSISGLQLSGFGTLPEVLEAGEIKSGTFKARKETYAVKTFAKMFALTRQAIINDDLGAFGDPIRVMSRASAETEASLLADLLNSNPAMSDSNALFHADHGNLASSGVVPSVAALSGGRFAMRSQKDLDGVTPIAAAPKYILSSPTFETTIEQLIATSLTPAQVDNANPFAGKLEPLVDPRLDALPWYLFADPIASPVLEYAYLEGHEGPRVEMQDGWTTLGTSFRVYMDFGAGLVDWRGAYKNPGAAPS